MRDFYAAAATVLILVDLGPHLLVVFALVASGWFAVTLDGGVSEPGPARTRSG